MLAVDLPRLLLSEAKEKKFEHPGTNIGCVQIVDDNGVPFIHDNPRVTVSHKEISRGRHWFYISATQRPCFSFRCCADVMLACLIVPDKIHPANPMLSYTTAGGVHTGDVVNVSCRHGWTVGMHKGIGASAERTWIVDGDSPRYNPVTTKGHHAAGEDEARPGDELLERNDNSASGFTGVYRRGKRWASCCRKQGKYLTVGSFDTPLQAARARAARMAEMGSEPLPESSTVAAGASAATAPSSAPPPAAPAAASPAAPAAVLGLGICNLAPWYV